MPHVPRLICDGHEIPTEMSCSKVGVRVRVDLKSGEPYYLISMDRWTCSRCHRSVLLAGPDQPPIREHFDPEFDPEDCDTSARLRS